MKVEVFAMDSAIEISSDSDVEIQETRTNLPQGSVFFFSPILCYLFLTLW